VAENYGSHPDSHGLLTFKLRSAAGDNIPVEDLIPRVGPYDKWATMWGYKPISGARTPERGKENTRRVGTGAGIPSRGSAFRPPTAAARPR